MALRGGVDQLGVDAHPRAGFLYAAFQHVRDAQLPAHLPNVRRLALVSKGRMAGDDEQAEEPGKVGDEVIGDCVAEVVLFWVAAEVLERQNGDRRLRRKLERGALLGPVPSNVGGAHLHAEDLERLGDVLDGLPPKILERKVQTFFYLIVDARGKAKTPGLC